MRPVFPCPHCGTHFGDEVWRDNHAHACAKIQRAAEKTAKPRYPRQRGHCPHCQQFMPVHELDAHFGACRTERTERIRSWMIAAAESRQRNGVPDWTDGLLKEAAA